MAMGARVLVCHLLFLCVPLPCRAELSREQQIETLNEALRAFDRGTDLRSTNPPEAARAFRESAEKLQAVVDSGIRNGKLYYNLGNAYLRCGELGRAILNYRRAERLIPGDGQLEANLRFARGLRQNQIPPSGRASLVRTFFAWHFDVPIRWRFAVGLACYVAFWCLLLVRIYWRTIRWGLTGVPLLILWLTLGASVAYETLIQSRQAEGVLIADEVIVRKSYGDGAEQQFDQPLHQGVEFAVLDRRPDWILIELPDGKSGWIRMSKAELI